MKLGFYFGLAKDGIRKNGKIYIPYILTCIGMVMMYYIIMALHMDETISHIRGGKNVQMVLGFGRWVIAIFSCIFLFYTNSFLMKRRNKEFGLYNILGMGKKELTIILSCESIVVAVVSIVIGLVFGITLAKFAQLGLLNMIKIDVDYSFFIGIKAIISTVKIFLAIFLAVFLNNLRQIYFSKTIDLLSSDKVGEKPPKANWILAVLGVVLLGYAYYTSVTIQNPIVAFSKFFIAVILVIFATYFLMVAGSVVMCKLLQKNKRFYYNKKHFVSVSSMTYRMKRNGAGLASICILATMVLIIISSTSCLYFGSEDALRARFPREILFSINFDDASQASIKNINTIKGGIEKAIEDCKVNKKNVYEIRSASIAGILEENKLDTAVGAYGSTDMQAMAHVALLYFIPIDDYNKMTGENVSLADDEALLFYSRTYDQKDIEIDGNTSFKVKKVLKKCPNMEDVGEEVAPIMVLYINDYDKALDEIKKIQDTEGGSRLIYSYKYGFDLNLPEEKQIEYGQKINDKFVADGYDCGTVSIEIREKERTDFYMSFGGIFYLGILLSIVFIFAAVLIIYYKQISEGYEDHARFDIMRKVGMTDSEIRKSINSQVLTVFYLPLILAGIHVCFAFPIVRKLLAMFSLYNVELFIRTSIVSFIIFAVLYAIVYKITSNSYYKIVSAKLNK